jgi:hypothetical protein
LTFCVDFRVAWTIREDLIPLFGQVSQPLNTLYLPTYRISAVQRFPALVYHPTNPDTAKWSQMEALGEEFEETTIPLLLQLRDLQKIRLHRQTGQSSHPYLVSIFQILPQQHQRRQWRRLPR